MGKKLATMRIEISVVVSRNVQENVPVRDTEAKMCENDVQAT